MAKLYIGNTAYKVMLGNNSGHIADLPTVVWNQLVNGLRFRTYNVEYSIETDTQIVDITPKAIKWRIDTSDKYNIIQNHKYCFSFEFLSQEPINTMSIDIRVNSDGKSNIQTALLTNVWNKSLKIVNISTSFENAFFSLYIVSAESVDKLIKFRNWQIFDLTLMFGAGNEPTTVAQLEQWFTDNIGSLDNYYPYNEGEEIKVKYLPQYM